MITTVLADQCADKMTFDISKTAAAYAAMAGILTGFAFSALTIVLNRADKRLGNVAETHELNGEKQYQSDVDRRTIIALLCAFIGLLLTTVQYSILAGESGCALVQGRAASEELLGAVAFASSVSILLYALVDLVAEGALRLDSEFRLIVAVILPPVLVYFVTDVMMDLALAMGWPDGRKEPMWSGAERAARCAALVTLVFCFYFRRRSRNSQRDASKTPRPTTGVAPYLTLVLVAGTTISATRLANWKPEAQISVLTAWLYLAALALLLVYASASLSREASVSPAVALWDRRVS